MRGVGNIAWWIGSLLVAVAFVGGWQLVADLKLVSPVYLPGPDRVWAALMRGLEGDLSRLFGHTVERMIYGWLLASFLGVVLGALVASSPRVRAYLEPTLDFIRPMPASAIVPVAIALIGLTEATTLTVIAFGSLWPVLLATYHGVRSVEPRLYELARSLNLPMRDVIFKIALPSAMPDILAGMGLALTGALILTVVGEMLTGRPGLGQWILISARSYQSPDLFAGVILLGLIGLVSTAILAVVEARLLRWRSADR